MGAEMRCDQCKSWEIDEHEWSAKNVGFGRCLAVREVWEIENGAAENWTKETYKDVMRIRAEAIKKHRAFVVDGSQYHATLYTAPDFFCALFGAKP